GAVRKLKHTVNKVLSLRDIQDDHHFSDNYKSMKISCVCPENSPDSFAVNGSTLYKIKLHKIE
ncbi:MAG: hypothetical protein LBH19_01815, partial [Dysgonamonadaceae bacterium]|nr:hypothetical protein [Dysgonamonadaceae bacterium]